MKVRRYRHTILRYKDDNWEDQEMRMDDDMSELIQHEYDHLDGILATMRAIDSKSFVMKESKSAGLRYMEERMYISIEPMTREQMHEMYQGFTMDSSIFDDMELFEQAKDYVYVPNKVDMLYEMRTSEEGSHLFAILMDEVVIGEVGLRHYNDETKDCELSIHMKNDYYKGKGFGTYAEKLAIDYAFDVLGAESIFAESLKKNKRSQHILEKLGFRYTGDSEGFRQYRLEKADRP